MKKKWPVIIAVLAVICLMVVYPASIMPILVSAFVILILLYSRKKVKEEEAIAAQKEAERQAAEEARLKEESEKEAARKAEEERLAAEAAEKAKQKWNPKLNVYDTPLSGCEQRVYHGAGMIHRMEALMELAKLNSNYTCTKREFKQFFLINRRVYEYNFVPETIDLVPEPENPHDPNSVKIIINERHVGYIRADETEGIVDLFNSEKVKRVQTVIEGGKYKILLGPEDFASIGVPITEYDLKKDEAPFSIKIYMDILIS